MTMRQSRFPFSPTPQDQVTYRRLMVGLTLVYGAIALAMVLYLVGQKPNRIRTEASVSAGQVSAAVPGVRYDR